MELKDKLLSSFTDFEKENHINDELTQIRRSALQTFETKGFPSKKEETWRYTSLRPILKEEYQLQAASDKKLDFQEIKPYLVDDLDSYLLIFSNGVFQKELSNLPDEKFGTLPLSQAFQEDRFKEVINKYYNKILPADDSLCAMNTAFSKEGTFMYLKKNQLMDKPIQMLYLSNGNEASMMLQPRNLFVVEENAQAKIIERHQSLGDNPTFSNSVTEIFVGANAIVDYYKIQKDRAQANLIDSTYIDQHDKSFFTCHTFSLGGKLTRNHLKASQNGEYIDSTFKGVTLLNDRQQVDHITFVHHIQPNNESHQDYKGMFDDRSHGVFDGYILVDKIAQKTNGYQKSDNILISDKAIAHAKPQLEIYADDVLCSHGCTVGQMDKDALMYMASRGIPQKEAKALMMYAFCNSVLSSVKIPELKKNAERWIGKKLGVNLEFHD